MPAIAVGVSLIALKASQKFGANIDYLIFMGFVNLLILVIGIYLSVMDLDEPIYIPIISIFVMAISVGVYTFLRLMHLRPLAKPALW